MDKVARRRSGAPARSFRLDKADGKLLGVCAGIANYLNADPLIVRAVFVLGALFGVGSFARAFMDAALSRRGRNRCRYRTGRFPRAA